MLKDSYKILDSLRLPHGLYLASSSTHYNYVWIRDSVYMSMPYLDKPCDTYERTYHRLLDLFAEYEDKIEYHTKVKPECTWQFIHSRFSADDVREITHEPWGHNQLDAIGAFLFGIGAGLAAGKQMLRNNADERIVAKIVAYLSCIEYWQCPDNGMWEEDMELHASSIGACVAGLISLINTVEVPLEIIDNGIAALRELGDRESASKDVDLAQLSLIYPYNLVGPDVAERIIAKVESSLLRKRGVIRYAGDSYYSTLESSHGRYEQKSFYYGTEAEWTFGLPWLALCCHTFGDTEKSVALHPPDRGSSVRRRDFAGTLLCRDGSAES